MRSRGGAQRGTAGNVVRDNRATRPDRAPCRAPGRRGTLILLWRDEHRRVHGRDGEQPNGTFDVFDYIALCRGHYEKNGIGADYIDRLFR